MWQQITVYLIVAAAAVYLGRYLFDSVSAIIRSRSGCGEGCSKCAFAAKSPVPARKNGPKTLTNIIPLSDIRSQPPK